MLNVDNLFIQWLNEIVFYMDATVNTQKWIRMIVTLIKFEYVDWLIDVDLKFFGFITNNAKNPEYLWPLWICIRNFVNNFFLISQPVAKMIEVNVPNVPSMNSAPSVDIRFTFSLIMSFDDKVLRRILRDSFFRLKLIVTLFTTFWSWTIISNPLEPAPMMRTSSPFEIV